MPRSDSESPVSWTVGIQKRPNRDHELFKSLKGYWLQSEDAAKLCRVSSSYFQRFVKHALGVRPDRLGRNNRWGGRVVLGALVCSALEHRFRVSSEWALIVGQSIASLPSDESCEAALESGRCFIVVAGSNASPILHDYPEVCDLDRELGPGLKTLGLQMQALDLRELWKDIRAAAGLEVENREFA